MTEQPHPAPTRPSRGPKDAKERELVVTWRPVAALIPYARNARTHSDAQVAQIAASIAEFGFTNPILAGSDGVIVAGHGRLAAGQFLVNGGEPLLAPVVEGLAARVGQGAELALGGTVLRQLFHQGVGGAQLGRAPHQHHLAQQGMVGDHASGEVIDLLAQLVDFGCHGGSPFGKWVRKGIVRPGPRGVEPAMIDCCRRRGLLARR